MADNDQNNDEYQFDNLDDMTPTSGEDNEEPVANPDAQEDMGPFNSPENNIKRNIFIGVVTFICALVIYKFIASSFSSKTPPLPAAVPAITPVVAAPVSPPEQPQPAMPAPQAVAPEIDAKINQTLAAIEVTEQGLRTDLTSINDQLSGLSGNFGAMMTKIIELNGIIVGLSTKIDEQAIVIEKLTINKRPKTHYVLNKHTQQGLKYYLKAVIPGRAWLIATNGTTLTVSEGTTIQGYGMVKLIDPTQGRVTTSSGQVIRFSQEDS